MIPSKLKVVELRAELSARGLDTKGNKAVLVERLEEALKCEDTQPAQSGDEEVDAPVGADETTELSQSDSAEAEHDREEEDPYISAKEPGRRDSEEEHQEEAAPDSSPEDSREGPPGNHSFTSRNQEDDNREYHSYREEQIRGSESPDHSLEQRRESGREDDNSGEPEYVGGRQDENSQGDSKLGDSEMGRFDQEGDDTDYNKNNHEGAVDENYPYPDNFGDGKQDYNDGKGELPGGKPDFEEDVEMKPDMTDIKEEKMQADAEVKEEKDDREERDHRRDRRAREGRDDRKRKRSSDRFSSQSRQAIKEDEPTIDETAVTLSWYDSDLNLKIDKTSLYTAQPLSEGGFGFIWAGARSTYGFTQGKVCFQVKVLENNDTSHLEDEPNPNVLRVGWSTFESSLQLGEEPFSYGFGGTGKISENCKFKDYGKPYGVNDVVTAYLDMTGRNAVISFSVNDEHFDPAYSIPISDLDGKALAPHILSKNIKYEVNFGQLDEPWFEPQPGYALAANVPFELRVRGPVAPASRDQCEMIMMCGLPAAGKTCWANQHAQENPEKRYNIIGTNALIDKMKVMGLPRKMNYSGRWDILIEKCTKCLQKLMDIGCGRRRNFILDQTNVYPGAQRRKMRNFEGFIKKAVVIVPTDEEFVLRTEKRENEEGKDVPDSAVMEMKANFTLPDKQMFTEVLYTELGEEEARELVEKYNKEAIDKGYKRVPPPRSDGAGGGGRNKRFKSSPGRGSGGYYERRGRGGGGGGGPRGDRGGPWGRRPNRFDNFDRRGPPPPSRFRGGGGGGMGSRSGGWNRGPPPDRSGGGGWRHHENRMGGGMGGGGGGGGYRSGGGGGGGGGWRGGAGGGGRGGGGRDGGGFRGRRDGPPRRDGGGGGGGGMGRDRRDRGPLPNDRPPNKGGNQQGGGGGGGAGAQQMQGQGQWNNYQGQQQTQGWGQQPGWGHQQTQGWGQQTQGWGQPAQGWTQQQMTANTNQQWKPQNNTSNNTTQQQQQGYPAAYATATQSYAYPGYNNWQGYQAYQAAYQQNWAQQQAASQQQATTQQQPTAAQQPQASATAQQ